MKVTVYMALSLDGKIARQDDDTGFISDEEWENGFIPAAVKAGNLVVGRRTYEVMSDDGSFEEFPEGMTVIVVTSKPDFEVKGENHFISNSPEGAVSIVEKQGMDEAFVCGGGILISGFLEKNMVDSISIDLEPVVIGKGISLCDGIPGDKRLKFTGMTKLSDDIIQLHYDVIRD